MGKLATLRKLASWYERQKRVLPWRDNPSFYRVWISEIMLQQTQVATVVPYFERFLERFPDVESLARASEDDVLLLWAGLGYYSRARNLLRGAKQIIQAGGFPHDREGWLEIPGVGEYTAGAILSIAGNLPEAILDGNVERVLSRMACVGRENGDQAYKKRLWDLSRGYVTGAHRAGIRPSVLNQSLMELGATVCTPREPSCGKCPFSGSCLARKSETVGDFPPRKKAKKWREVSEELHCVLDRRGRVLLRQRAKGEWRAGLWDLLAVAPRGARKLGQVESRHVVTTHKIRRSTQVWVSSLARAAARDLRWITVEDPEVAVGSALKRTLQAIREKYPLAMLKS